MVVIWNLNLARQNLIGTYNMEKITAYFTDTHINKVDILLLIIFVISVIFGG